MAPARALKPRSVWDLPSVLSAFREHGIKERHVYKLWSSLLKDPDVALADIPDLPKAACQLLDEQFTLCSSTVLMCQQSAGADTTKLLIQLQDGMQVEAVVMHYDTSGRYAGNKQMAGWGNKRGTLCVSSQVGCQMGCTFCATGTMGLKGHLCSGEIIEQLVHAIRVTSIRNIVFMGMGEPLSNYDAVKAAVGLMADPRVFGISRKHITLSTVGIIPRIKQMATDLPGVNLALSLHAPTQELRKRIVPSARAYPLHKLMDTIAEYQAATQQRVFVEYVMLAGVNDSVEQAHALGQLLQGNDILLNLLPWNPVYSPDGPHYAAPSAGRVQEFQSIVRSQYGIHCTVRQKKGQDIAGACGQLVIQHGQQGGSCSIEAAAPGGKDIEELVAAAGPTTAAS
eukprot:GHRR01006040.1.p1 GENE.GHRR01006040.1~~GHRR01006040.1.p1  ORF type:complete len:397 (+),score=116.87 GHRR01006040.1:290-1480(+)